MQQEMLTREDARPASVHSGASLAKPPALPVAKDRALSLPFQPTLLSEISESGDVCARVVSHILAGTTLRVVFYP